MTKLIKAGLLGGLILFIWSTVSWMVLPWHKATMHSFTIEKAVSQSIQSNAPRSGIYFFPSMCHPDRQKVQNLAETTNTKEMMTTTQCEPLLFVSVALEGMRPMPVAMGLDLAIEIAAALLVAWMLLQTQGLSYMRRVAFVVIFALAAGIFIHMCYWNWFMFDTQYTLVQVADLVVGWFLAGLVIAKICKK